MTAAAFLPQPVAEEILRRYADVLRVGSVEVNGVAVTWQTDTSTELQLENFCAALFARLRQLPELASAGDDILRQAAYWVCKAVSINYALIEVLLLVKRKVGVMCTIETRDDMGGLVTYSLEVRPAQMHVRLRWRGKNNIIYRDPQTAAKKVKGTLYGLETEFCLPPAQRFAPSYRLQMKFERSMAAKFVSTVTCKDIKSRAVLPTETIMIKDPLHTDHPADVTQNFDVTALEPLDIDEFCEGLQTRTISADSNPLAPMPSSPLRRAVSALPPSSPYTPLTMEPRRFTARSVRYTEDEARPAGQLRVRVLQALGLDLRGNLTELYCRCGVGDRTEQTSIARDRNAPGWWDEALDIPVQDRDLRGEVFVEVLDAAANNQQLGYLQVPVSTVLSNGGKALLTEPLAGARRGAVQLELVGSRGCRYKLRTKTPQGAMAPHRREACVWLLLLALGATRLLPALVTGRLAPSHCSHLRPPSKTCSSLRCSGPGNAEGVSQGNQQPEDEPDLGQSEGTGGQDSDLPSDADMAVLQQRIREARERPVLPVLLIDSMLPGQRLRFQSKDAIFSRLVEPGEVAVIGAWQGSPLTCGVKAKLVEVGENEWELRGQDHVRIAGEAKKSDEGFTVAPFEFVKDEVVELDVTVAKTLPPLVQRWRLLVEGSSFERFKGQVQGILEDLGPMPPAEEAGRLAMWVAALVNPLPALGVAYEIRPAALTASTVAKRLEVALQGIQGSIGHVSGEKKLF